MERVMANECCKQPDPHVSEMEQIGVPKLGKKETTVWIIR
jgi:hypothetical protein